MKTYVLKLALLFFGLSLIFSCEPGIVIPSNTPLDFAYTLHVDSTFNTNAPALQSFAHGTHKGDWLLFAGRTNSKDSLGGLHDLDKSYTTSASFPKQSFNENIFVYNVKNDQRYSISYDKLLKVVEKNFSEYDSILKENRSVFVNTNSQVAQLGEFMYLVGGYGPPDANSTSKYTTYNQIAKIHVPSLINLVKGNGTAVDKNKLFAFGKHKNLVATGGELQIVGNAEDPNFYLVGGHNFGYSCVENCDAFYQKYQDAVYNFDIKEGKGNELKISLSQVISDVSCPECLAADNISVMRRRDGPILPQLFKNPSGSTIEQGFGFFAGVFTPTDGAWNDAVYIHPGFLNAESKLYTIDSAYNQKNYNVYSCPNFALYDPKGETVHSFLMGGIGDGKRNVDSIGFTNTATHIKTNITNMKSTRTLINPDHLFNVSNKNKPIFYGAEAIFFGDDALDKAYVKKDTVEIETEIFDMSKFGNGDVFVGYIYGGIEAYESNPGTYGNKKSMASKKIFKVTLKKK